MHWTAHPSRLDRQLGGRFGDDAYAAEELIAEMGSAFLCAHCRIDGQLQHASYIASLAEGPAQRQAGDLRGGTKAQNAADFLLARGTETSGAEALAA